MDAHTQNRIEDRKRKRNHHLRSLPGVPRLLGVVTVPIPFAFLGVIVVAIVVPPCDNDTPNPSPVLVSLLSLTPTPPPSPTTRWTSLAARLAASPICAGGRSASIRDNARRRSCGSWTWLVARLCARELGSESGWVGKSWEADEGAGREREREESARERRENRASRSSEAAFVVWSAVFRYDLRLSICHNMVFRVV